MPLDAQGAAAEAVASAKTASEEGSGVGPFGVGAGFDLLSVLNVRLV